MFSSVDDDGDATLNAVTMNQESIDDESGCWVLPLKTHMKC